MSTAQKTPSGRRQPSKPKIKRTPKAPRQQLPLLDMERRISTPEEVSLGFTLEQAAAEALRCLNCRDPKCQEACPIHTDIKGFIDRMVHDDYSGAYDVLQQTNPFPGICGRVCQYELFCEKACLLGTKLDPVAIGSLERFVADYHRQRGETDPLPEVAPNGLKVGMVGSGPASLLCANDLARKGYQVTVFEALHELGGVLAYGIPPFRLPRQIISEEIRRLEKLGVEFRTDFIVGRTATLDELFAEGYAAVFLGTGAGLPWLLGIPGENLIGVYTANEFLTRINLMHAYEPDADTPVHVGKRTIVVGGGNSAMDAARWARRLGSESIILYRRGRKELKARAAEIEHAEEEGIIFKFLAAPVRLFGNDKGFVTEMECIRMELGEPDESGRRRPIPIQGSEFRIPADTVVAAIGQAPNPTLQRATPQLVTSRGKVVIDNRAKTSMDRVYAGGDVVRGGSTVILAMEDGRRAAASIDQAMRERFPEHFRSAAAVAKPAGKSKPAPRTFPIGSRSGQTRREKQTGAQIPHLDPAATLHGRGPAGGARARDSEALEARPVCHSPAHGYQRAHSAHAGRRRRRAREHHADCPGHWKNNPATGFSQGGRLPGGPARSSRQGRPLEKQPGNWLLSRRETAWRTCSVLSARPATSRKSARTVMCIGGGVGVAELLPVARAFKKAGNRVIAMCGARTKDLIILEEELRDSVDELHWATDDGTYGFHGNVVQMMKAWRKDHAEPIHAAHVIGPIPMMRFSSELTREWGVPTVASLNPIMVDGTGMCGGCRVTVGGEVKFACVWISTNSRTAPAPTSSMRNEPSSGTSA